MIKGWCSRIAQIGNKIDAFEGSFEIASANALFYLENIFASERAFPYYLEGVVKTFFRASTP